MNTNLFDHVNIDKTRTFVPDGLEADSEKACNDYNAVIRKQGGVDLQLLGLGHNGHIGFNEPGAAFEKETHCVDLTEVQLKPISVSSNLKMMFRDRLIQWESRISCRPRKFWLL